jgi:hypothetical protein
MSGEDGVTLAVIQRDIKHLGEITNNGFKNLEADLSEVKGLAKDNSTRIREVERRQDKQGAISNMVDGLIGLGALIGSILGIRS